MSEQSTRVQSGSGERSFTVPSEVSVLPLRDTVLFPNSFMPLAVARASSVALIDDAIASAKVIGVFTQKDPSQEEPGEADLHQVGTLTHIHKMFKLPDGSLRLIVQGLTRLRLDQVVATRPYLRANVSELPDEVQEADALEIDALERNIRANFAQVVQLSPVLSDDLTALASNISDVSRLTDFVASSLSTISTSARQELLATPSLRARMDQLNRILTKELEVLELGSKIQSQVQSEVGKGQREYFLREQMKAIQRELGEGDDQAREIEELRERIEAAGMPEDVQKEALRELDRLSKMPAAAAEYTVARTYIDWLVALPWNKRTEEVIDLKRTKEVLDADHSGLERPKDRILEYLAVRKLKPDIKGPILCLVGPPGVGKTSLAKSIASSLDRKFVRVSLGGMRDEAEIRGHRRTYIGALPGQIIQGLRRAESRNPVFILDEIDKLGSDFRGDPASALLEVLDPEQNNAFRDHYLDVPFDLSEVLFITTANVIDTIPAPLRDRMEVLELSGYTGEEKLKIARDHLIDRQIANHGLTVDRVTFTDDAIRSIIHGYTREAGVRNLERMIGSVVRKIARRYAEGQTEPVRVTPETVEELLGSVCRRRDARPHARSGSCCWTGLDTGRWRRAVCRGVEDAGWQSVDAYRSARRRHEGIGANRVVVGPGQRVAIRRGPDLLQGFGDPPARAGRSHPQGWSISRGHDGDGAGIGVVGASGSSRRGDDRRNHPVGPRPARRRDQGKGAGCPAHGDPRDHSAQAERAEHSRGPDPGAA
jgi:ATP-dependent Lon protease